MDDITNLPLPRRPDKLNTLYGDEQQIEITCKFLNLALYRMAEGAAASLLQNTHDNNQ